MKLLHTLNFIARHPLNRTHPFRAIWRFIKWQLNTRLNPYPIVYPFTTKSKLLIKKGLTGATGNLYCGLHEFEEMAFTLHFLRIGDTFVDIGANIGSYTVLASGHVGARTVAFEPIPHTFQILQQNVAINQMDELVQLYNMAVSAQAGNIKFVYNEDTMNHAATSEETNTMEVTTDTLDNLLDNIEPLLIKIDVEGFETEVLKGAVKTLSNTKLCAIIIELNGSGQRYGFNEELIHMQLNEAGFYPFYYNPFKRLLTLLSTYGLHNTIYIRNKDYVEKRLQTAPLIEVNCFSF